MVFLKHIPTLLIFLCTMTPLIGQGFTNVERYTDLSSTQKIYAIVIDNEDNKYVGTDEGLFKILNTSQVLEKVQEGSKVTHLAWDNKSGLWAVKEGNTVYQPLADRTFTFEEEGLKINCIDASSTILYVGTNLGLFRVALDDGELEQRKSKADQLLSKVSINTIFVDPSRVRWIGTDEGVFRLEYKKLNYYEKSSRITSMAYTSEGVWIVGDEEMWLVDNYNRWAPAAVDRGLRQGSVTAMTSDKRGNVYLASGELVQFNPYTDEIYTLDEEFGFVDAVSTALVCDQQDQVWVGTADQGLFKINIKTDKPIELTAVIVETEKLSCFDDMEASLKVVVNGAQGEPTIEWEDMDHTEAELMGVGPGEYFVTVSDSMGKSYTTSKIIQAPRAIEIIINKKTFTTDGRKNGTASISIQGGTEPFTVDWSGGQRGLEVEKLAAGKQLVTVVDDNGCYGSREIEIEEEKVLADLSIDKLTVGTTLNIEKLFFDADSTKIKPESFPVLNEIYSFLAQNNQVVIEIGGHTNSIPEEAYCDRLSKARAQSVAEYLYGKGIGNNRIAFKGYGKRNPIATNETRVGRQKNQRVEIKILSL